MGMAVSTLSQSPKWITNSAISHGTTVALMEDIDVWFLSLLNGFSWTEYVTSIGGAGRVSAVCEDNQ